MSRAHTLGLVYLLFALPGLGADLIIDGTSYTINQDTTIAGNIFVENGGTLTVTGCTLTLALTFDEQYHIDVSGPSSLIIQNATILSTGGQFYFELYDDGNGSPTMNVGGQTTWLTNHSGIRPYDQTVVTVTGGDVEELQANDQVQVTLSNAATYPVFFFDAQSSVIPRLDTGPSITNTISVPGGWSFALQAAQVDGYQIDLMNGASVRLTDGDGIVLSMHTPGNLTPGLHIVEGLTSNGTSSGSLTSLGTSFYYQNSNIALFNVYVFGTDQVLLRNIHVNEVNAEADTYVTVGQVGYQTLLNANLAQVYDNATMDVVSATIDATGNTPSAACSYHDLANQGNGILNFYDMDLTALYITALEYGTINLYNCTYDPAKVAIVDPTATFNVYNGSRALFDATPRSGTVPLNVAFTDLSTATPLSWQWDFGDSQTSTAQNPSHSYATIGRYTVSLTVTDSSGQDTSIEQDYILASQNALPSIVTGPGSDPGAPPRVLGFDVLGTKLPATDIIPYGATGYGVNVAAGELDGTAPKEILTGPGPGAVYGPQIRAFQPSSQPLAKVNFFAYGTLRFGAAAWRAELDADGFDEILTAAGHGAVFGPHVRGFNYDGSNLTSISNISFFSYQTLKYGVNVNSGQIGGTTDDEILTAPGPGPTFGPQIRGFSYGPPLTGMSGVNFFAFTSSPFGGRIASGDLDGDGWAELLAGKGPDPTLTGTVKAFDYDDTAIAGIPGVLFDAIAGALYGARPSGGDFDGDGLDEILVSRGPDPLGNAFAQGIEPGPPPVAIPSLTLLPYSSAYGVDAAGF